ncbi:MULTISPECIES: MarR family transcriptional regulator [Microbacterium]|uniref:HTH marR-type domain-containing protein n=1 Tax=Microbacterium barkeri TaxID=33917 RepID=A0A9W6H2M2_9MICO|nr:MarR family transcriptional regulator [Microbacterium barkeri]MDR6878114.1 DNA-binding MarR family transcriptional regulator [Microbacterium barkeri]GLJ61501.1 hypothetical protein GCM10017576_16300 [Microbacterium barkeri]
MPDDVPTRAALADLADAVLTLARELDLRVGEDPEIIPLTATARMVLRFVHHHPGVSPSGIADRLALKRPNVSEALRQLERLGLVSRSRPAGDGRGVVVAITPLAEANLERLRRVWARALSPAADLDVAMLTDTMSALADEVARDRREADDRS